MPVTTHKVSKTDPPKSTLANFLLGFTYRLWLKSCFTGTKVTPKQLCQYEVLGHDLMEAELHSLSVNLLLLMYSGISQDHLQLGEGREETMAGVQGEVLGPFPLPSTREYQ